MADRPDSETLLDLTVAELLERWPAASAPFIQHRLACLGCSFSAFDTVREALEIHSLPEAHFLATLRAALALSTPALPDAPPPLGGPP